VTKGGEGKEREREGTRGEERVVHWGTEMIRAGGEKGRENRKKNAGIPAYGKKEQSSIPDLKGEFRHTKTVPMRQKRGKKRGGAD